MANSSSSGGLGCFSTILVLIGIWALLFGVTCNGVHHGVYCSASNGVEIK